MRRVLIILALLGLLAYGLYTLVVLGMREVQRWEAAQ